MRKLSDWSCFDGRYGQVGPLVAHLGNEGWQSYVVYPQEASRKVMWKARTELAEWIWSAPVVEPFRAESPQGGLIDPSEQFTPPEEPRAAPRLSLGEMWGNERWGK